MQPGPKSGGGLNISCVAALAAGSKGSRLNEDCVDSSLTLCMRNLPSPHTARLLAVSIPVRSPG